MANKQVKYTFGGANQDISKSKHPVQFYFEGQHIKLLSTDTQATGNIANEKGTELVITLPSINIIGLQQPDIIANNDIVDVVINGTIVINVLANDEYLYPVTVTMITPPNIGSYTINTNNTITYTDVVGLVDIDSFVYQIDDGNSIDTASVTINIVQEVIIPPIDDEILIPGETTNFDGQYYRYIFAPCDRTISFIRVKSSIKIIDNDIYTILGSGGVGKEGAVAYKDTDLSPTIWTIGTKYGLNCPPN